MRQERCGCMWWRNHSLVKQLSACGLLLFLFRPPTVACTQPDPVRPPPPMSSNQGLEGTPPADVDRGARPPSSPAATDISEPPPPQQQPPQQQPPPQPQSQQQRQDRSFEAQPQCIRSSKRTFDANRSEQQNEMNGTTRKRRGTKNPEDGPHFGLPISPLREGDKQAFVRHVISTNRSGDDGMDVGLHFTACEQMMVDSSTVLQLTLADLHFSPTMECLRGYYDSVLHDDTSMLDSRMLYVTRHPSVTRKDRATNKKSKRMGVVGCLRHQHVLQCFTSMTSMAFFVRHRSNRNLFATTDWRNERLLSTCGNNDGDNSKAIQKAYNDVFEALCIASNRCSHLDPSYSGSASGELLMAIMTTSTRATRTGRTGPRNFRSTAAATTTTKSFDTIFGPDSHRNILISMAGFSKPPPARERYHVPRVQLPIDTWWPGGMDFATNALFPHYAEWLAKHDADDNDDDGSSAETTTFLKNIVPFFAKVIVQDGCFWVDMFPNHEVSNLLRTLLPNYERLAAQARQWCENQEVAAAAAAAAATSIQEESDTPSYEDFQRMIDKLRAAGRQRMQQENQQEQVQRR